MKHRSPARTTQRGAVAIMLVLSLAALVGLMGLALDLSQTYDRKTELQNAADAAALAGAKKLDGTAAGITAAVTNAKAKAALNKFKFGTAIALPDASFTFSESPDLTASWLSVSAASTNPAGLYFIKVDTNGGNAAYGQVSTNFIQVLSGAPNTTSTFGLAVAGRFVVNITPLAMCQLYDDPSNTNDNELGYERGVSYKLSDANPIGPGTPYAIDPTATQAGTCSGSTNTTLPFFCTGKIAFTPKIGMNVYTNTGLADAQLEALDSRFDVFNSKNKCDPATAPPDLNIKEYNCSNNKGTDGCLKDSATASTVGLPRDWMESDPVRQSIQFAIDALNVNRPIPIATRTFPDYGVLWAGAQATQWPAGGTQTSYPAPSPYAQTSGNFFQAPNILHKGEKNRRVMNIAIVTCPTAGGNCRPATVQGFGKFFMQKKANVPGDKDVYLEFEGLLDERLLIAEVRLYR